MARILVVDDMTGVRRSISVILSALGHEIVEAVNGQAALDILQKDPDVSVVITDILMPEMDGIDLISRIRALEHAAKIVVISGGGNRRDVESIMKKAEDYAYQTLRKPFQREDLIRVLGQVL